LAIVSFYNFYKNTALVVGSLYYTIYCAFTGNSIHERWVISFYNTFYTCFPIVFLGVFDQDLPEKRVEEFPELYQQGRDGSFYSFWKFIRASLNAAYHGAICFFLPIYLLQTYEVSERLTIGITIFTCVVITINLKLILDHGRLTILSLLSYPAGLLCWVIFVFVYCNMQRIFDLEDWRGGLEGYKILFEPIFYLIVLVTVVIALLKDISFKALEKLLFIKSLYYRSMDKRESEQVLRAEFPRKIIDPKLKKKSKVEKALEGTKEKLLKERKKYLGFAFTFNSTAEKVIKEHYQRESSKSKIPKDSEM
jgi:magnesium-transporting ATPase (P-type)